jgi:sugar phosphate isomerase/epimerase
MRAPLGTYSRIGLLHAALYPEDSLEGIRTSIRVIAADDFFGAVEITPVRDQALRRELCGVLQASQMVIDVDAGAGLYRGGLSLASLSADARARAAAYVRSVVDEASEMQAERVCVISGPDPGEASRRDALAALEDTLLDLCGYARANGTVQLALKMADRAVDKRFLIGPTWEGARVARVLRQQYPDFGVVLNLGHLALLDEDPEQAVQHAAPVLARVHLGNCVRSDRNHPRYGDSHPGFGIAGGEIDVPELAGFLRALVTVGYLRQGNNAVVAFEVRPGPGEDPATVIAHCKHVLAAAWAEV